LLSDSLDNLGDALTYALSLYVVSRSTREKAVVALFKGGLILAAGLFVLGQVVYRLWLPAMPMFDTMGVVGLLSLLANSLCLFLLWKHKGDDINMASVWACSRNDIATNLAVILTAGAVWLFNAAWPDLVVGLALAVLLISSSIKVLSSAFHALRRAD
jgi:Co/Zn/Cd efflux system component